MTFILQQVSRWSPARHQPTGCWHQSSLWNYAMGSTFGNREFSPPTSCWIKQSKGTLTFHSIGWCMKMLLRVYVYHNPYIPGESKTPLYPKTTRVIFSQLNLLKPFKVSEKTHHRESSLVFQCFCSTLAMHQPVISPCLVLLKQPPNGGPQKVWKWNPSKGNVKREPKTTLVKSEGLSLKKHIPLEIIWGVWSLASYHDWGESITFTCCILTLEEKPRKQIQFLGFRTPSSAPLSS